jgi:hypothetical protein
VTDTLQLGSYPAAFKPRATNDLARIGAPNDGGYVIPTRVLAASKGLLSFGLSDEWDFEREFATKSGAPLVCFDPNVNPKFWLQRFIIGFSTGLLTFSWIIFKRSFRFIDYKRFFDGEKHRHIAKAIGYPSENSLTLFQAIAAANLPGPLFLKMDIEGWEYRIIFDLAKERKKFVGMVIEFHDIDLHEDQIRQFIQQLDDTFILVHFHANDNTLDGPEGTARAVEMTFMSRSLLGPEEVTSYVPLPIPVLDAPNRKGQKQAAVTFKI